MIAPARPGDIMTIGRIDVHSHILPAIDDGCASVEDSLACARVLVSEGYTHTFVTPHFWPSFPANTIPRIAAHAMKLQQALNEHQIPLRLIPGGEIGLREETAQTPIDELVTYGSEGKYLLFDLWADALPDYFYTTVEWFLAQGVQPILAHPERMRAVHFKPDLMKEFAKLGLLLQGNLQCLSDSPGHPMREIIEEGLREQRYFMLGSDTHNLATLNIRMNGLKRAIEAVGEKEVWRLTSENPRQLLPASVVEK